MSRNPESMQSGHLKTQVQPSPQIVMVSGWEAVDGFGIYPEGSRDKQLLRSPTDPVFPFLKPNWKYLLKYSRSRCPHQYWCEILAYRLGILAGVPVPPAHCAVDKEGRCATLIEWFLDDELRVSKTLDFRHERKYSGGDWLQAIDPGFEREKGKRHSWKLVRELFNDPERVSLFQDWKNTWFEMLAFDAFIGNTDRHQENWAIIQTSWWEGGKPRHSLKLGPFFDNGTALGYELEEDKVGRYSGSILEKYIRNGRSHLKWEPEETKGMRHFKLLSHVLKEYPEGKRVIDRYRKISSESIHQTCLDLCDFRVQTELSRDRAEFMARLVDLRRQKLIELPYGIP